MKKVAIVFSGCGVFDGAEITESVLTLLALDKAGASVTCAAPNVNQKHVVNHLSGDVAEGETRNVLVESARIARGDIAALDTLNPAEFDAVIFPGGYGAAKNLCSLGFDGAEYDTDPTVADFVEKASEAGKPLGFICIAPAVAAQVLGDRKVRLTIGNDADTAAALERKGARHVACAVDDIVIDEDLAVVSTPAYMLAQSPKEAEAGIAKLVDAVLAKA